MYAIDFEYDGKYLSDYGFIVCDFNSLKGVASTNAGSKITFLKMTRNGGRKYGVASAKYAECLTATFDICKDPEKYDADERIITSEEFRDIMRWLNRREFCRFQVLYDEKNHEACFYNASFNIDKLKISDRFYGMRLTMETDKPFGYGEEQKTSFSFRNANLSGTFFDESDEIGTTTPSMRIKCISAGNLTIQNDVTGCAMTIKNCAANEVITINGDTEMIETSLSTHDIANDFNYDYFTMANTMDSRMNHIAVSLPCDVMIRYYPIIKESL